MSKALTIEEELVIISAALKYLVPIYIKYELANDSKLRSAMIEAFQAGITFWHEEGQK